MNYWDDFILAVIKAIGIVILIVLCILGVGMLVQLVMGILTGGLP